MSNSLTELKRPLYDNCCVYSIDGALLFKSNKKRALWYVERNLATVLKEDPFEIKLNFITKGLGHKDDPFYLQSRDNICIVCGSEAELTRHHIVPFCFRRFFPLEKKD